jgi:hypothetical protein
MNTLFLVTGAVAARGALRPKDGLNLIGGGDKVVTGDVAARGALRPLPGWRAVGGGSLTLAHENAGRNHESRPATLNSPEALYRQLGEVREKTVGL